MNTVITRWLTAQLQAVLKVLPVAVITGARQTGKTTLVRNIRADRPYFTLDEISLLDQAEWDPDSLCTHPPVTLDEVQRVPKLLLAVKRQVDRKRNAGDFMLTGSANLSLLGLVSESLAGRAAYLDLPPFCPREWLRNPQKLTPLDSLFENNFDYRRWPTENGDWLAWLLRGGYAPVLQLDSDQARDIWFSGYSQSYLERDLRQLSDVASLPDFRRLMALAAQRSARLLNQSELARDAALSQPTCHRYLNLLETGYLITRLSTYATNPATSLIKAKKLFWNDCGLGAWLAGIRSTEALESRMDQGYWLEQTIFQSLQTWRTLDQANRRLYYWRDRSGKEVDFILEQQGKLVALEIKTSRQATLEDARGILAFRSGVGRSARFCNGVVLHAGEGRPLGENLYALPWHWLVPAADKNR
ncbi:MAG: ATP-binding protein [Phycisphaerales bacterium]|nr:ATP-binding protein [Phycisphaerales bacterium]